MTTGLSEDLILEIHNKLVEESDAEIDANDIKPSMNLRDDLEMDSMQAVSLILDLEELLNIALDGDEISTIQTVGDLHNIVELKLNQKASG